LAALLPLAMGFAITFIVAQVWRLIAGWELIWKFHHQIPTRGFLSWEFSYMRARFCCTPSDHFLWLYKLGSTTPAISCGFKELSKNWLTWRAYFVGSASMAL
jgi:hypothetical protein